jgi:hypothetical protein
VAWVLSKTGKDRAEGVERADRCPCSTVSHVARSYTQRACEERNPQSRQHLVPRAVVQPRNIRVDFVEGAVSWHMPCEDCDTVSVRTGATCGVCRSYATTPTLPSAPGDDDRIGQESAGKIMGMSTLLPVDARLAARTLVLDPPLTDAELEELCRANDNVRIERTREGVIT